MAVFAELVAQIELVPMLAPLCVFALYNSVLACMFPANLVALKAQAFLWPSQALLALVTLGCVSVDVVLSLLQAPHRGLAFEAFHIAAAASCLAVQVATIHLLRRNQLTWRWLRMLQIGDGIACFAGQITAPPVLHGGIQLVLGRSCAPIIVAAACTPAFRIGLAATAAGRRIALRNTYTSHKTIVPAAGPMQAAAQARI